MSATETEVPAVEEAAEVVVTEEERIEALMLSDNSSITDRKTFDEARETLSKLAGAMVKLGNQLGGLKGQAAEARVLIRSTIKRASGFPDWGAQSELYKQVIQLTETSLYAGLDEQERTSLMSSIAQRVKRNVIVPAQVAYIMTHEADLIPSDEVDKWENEATRGDVHANPSKALRDRVAAHQKDANLTIDPKGQWSQFLPTGTVNTPGAGNEPSDPPSPLEALGTALGGLTQITPRMAVAALLQSVSAVSAKQLDPDKTKMNTVENPAYVQAAWERIAVIAHQTAAAFDGSDVDDAALIVAYFDPKEDTPEA